MATGRTSAETDRRGAYRRLVLLLMLAAGLLAAGYMASLAYFERAAFTRAEARAALYRSTLLAELQRFQHLPYVLARDEGLIGARDRGAMRELSRRLEEIADVAGVEFLYVLDAAGRTLAASNHAAPQSLVGQNYGFRPYFQDALAGRRGEFYAIGATTLRPGYFIAERMAGAEGWRGVMAVKVDLSPLQEAWRAGGETVLVTNADGVVVLSSDPARLYGALGPISAERRAAIRAERQFADAPLEPLGVAAAPRRWSLGGAEYVHASAAISRMGWRLHYLAPAGAVRERAVFAAIIVAVALGAVLLVAVAARSARLSAALRTSQRHREELQRSNAKLRQAQADLAEATKLAALGQLAAAVTHELGQPISAMRNYLAAAELGGRPEDRATALERVSAIVGRMESVTQQLRHFSRPAPPPEGVVDLREALEGAELLMAHDIDAAGVALAAQAGPAPALVRGDRMRLEQALVNLMKNAVAAMEESPERRLSVRIAADGDAARIEVSDTGHGLGARTLRELAEPFHTTRPSGEGMGLGLAIAAAIVREHGGRLSATNGAGGGAVFRIELPLLSAPDSPTRDAPEPAPQPASDEVDA